jgi:peptidoglycan/LPS O-acetylase OafA/YrhL
MTETAYRRDIDGLRAIAVLFVIVFHAFPKIVPGGFSGVDIFFVISGYLITGIILRELATNTFSIANFYMRRVRRIFPALLAILLFTVVLGWLFSCQTTSSRWEETFTLGRCSLRTSCFFRKLATSIPRPN